MLISLSGGMVQLFANLAFCKPDIKLLEIRQKDHYVSLKKISKVNKFEHKVWLIETNEKGKMYVGYKKIRKLSFFRLNDSF